MQRVSLVRHVASTYQKGSNARWLQYRYASTQRLAPARNSARRPSYEAPSKPPPSKEAIAKARTLPLVLACLTGAGIGLYGVQLVIAANRQCPNSKITDLAEQKDVADRYDETADSFDAEVGMSEWLMGVNRLRKRMAAQCKGHVLEVSCGTGRNLGYFDIGTKGNVSSLTFVDLSPQMVEVCRKKWNVLFGTKRNNLKQHLAVRFLPASALGPLPLAPSSPPKKYDAIIQTMGLCSTANPVELVENMVQHLDTSNPDARIFLLEHGRSYQQWLNNILDNSAEKHAEIHGCWFNRDIGALVQDAASKTGLEVVQERRHHLGTTWFFELKPKPEHKAFLASETDDEGSSPATKSTWFSWLK